MEAMQCQEEYKAIRWLVLLRDYPDSLCLIYAIKNLHLPLTAERAYLLAHELLDRFAQASPALIEGYIRTQLLQQTDGLDIPKVTFYSILLDLANNYGVWSIISTLRSAIGGL